MNGENTSRRDFILESAAAAAALSMGNSRSAGASQVSKRRPNIVLIVGDDIGYGDTGLYGHDTVPTPNLKRIADNGALFTNGYVSSPVCSPSRAGLITGCHQQRFGHEFNPPLWGEHDEGIPQGELTLADTMKEAGYVTGMVGKWHLGQKEEFNPINRGFDEFFGCFENASGYIDPSLPDARLAGRRAAGGNKWKGATAQIPAQGRRPIMRGTTPVEEEDHLTDAFSREAVAFIDRHKTEPFFLYLPYNAAHQPLQTKSKYYDRFPHIEDERKRVYAAMISALDDGVGSILDALEANGLEKDTMVFYISDNGAGVDTYCSNGPLRLGKGTLFEGGIRVPFCVKWPRHIPKGETYEHPVSALDVFPTAVAAAGGTLPTDRPRDGVNLIPYLNGSIAGRPHENLFWRSGPNWAVREGDWKLLCAEGRYWLYDLSEDLGEETNVAQKHPAIVERIKAAYEKWNSQMVDPLWPCQGAKQSPQFAVDGVTIKWEI